MFIKYVDLKHPKRMTETELRSIIKKMLNEALSSFPNQYEIAKICTDNLFEMFKNGENEMEIDIFSHGINKIVLHVDNGKYSAAMQSDFASRNMHIWIGYLNWHNRSWDELYDAVVHELMHGNVDMNRLNHVRDVNKISDTPDIYSALIEIAREKAGTIAGRYAYALYSTYYQEANAMVSQTYSSMKAEYNRLGLKKISKRGFMKLIERSSTWEIFSGNILDCCNVIAKMDDKSIKTEIADIFATYEINMNIKNIKHSLKRILNVSNDALRKCVKNSMFFYNELKEKNLIN